MNSDIGDDPAPTLSISAFEAITFITSAVLSGHIIITGSGPFSTSLTITFSFLFLSTAVMIVGAIWTIARRRASTDGLTASASATAIRSYTEGGIVGILAAGGSFLVSLSLPGGLVSGALTTSAVFIFLYCTVLIGTSALCGRQSAGKAQWGPQWWRQLRHELLVAHLPLFGAMSIVVIIGIITYTVKGTFTFAQASMALFTLPYTVIMVSALAFFGSFAAALPPDLPLAFLPQGFTSLTESFTLVDDLPFWGWNIVLAAFLSLLISALLVGIGRPRTATFGWKRVGLLPAVSLPLWVGAIYLVANVHFFGSNGFSGSAGIALSSGVHLAVAMLAVSVLAKFLPFALHRISPAIVVMLCGKERTDVWLSGQDATPPQSDPVLGEPGASVAPPLPASQAMDPTLKKRLVSALVLAGVFAVLAMGAGIAAKILNSSRTADIAVAQYAQALAAGNAELANAMIDPGIRSDDRALLSTEVVTSATEKLSVVGVAVEEENPVASVVQVTYSLDGEHFTEEYLATPGPKEYGVLNTWKLSGSPTKTITIHSPRFSQVRVNGVAIEVPHDQQHVEVKVYPGIYTVSAPVATYLTAADTEVRVGPTSSQPVVELKPEPTQALRDKILQEAQDYVASCASSPGNLDLSCPYQVQNPRLDKLELTPSVSSIELDESLHFTTDKAAITLREKPGFFVNNPKDKLIEFTVRGGVIVDDPQNPEIVLSSGW